MKMSSSDKTFVTYDEYCSEYFPDTIAKKTSLNSINPIQLGNEIATQSITELRKNLNKKT